MDISTIILEGGPLGVAVGGLYFISKLFLKTINERDEVHRVFLKDMMSEDRLLREEDRQARREDRDARTADRQEHRESYSKLSSSLDKLAAELKAKP
jgi:hypothetical protein